MIIGNPITLGGGGGLTDSDAILRVQAPAGSTVTISKGSTTKSDQGHENADNPSIYDYYFVIHQSQFDSVNPWTVTATKDIGVDSETVIIDDNVEYNITLNPILPADYQPVEYLQSTGTQYIITSYKQVSTVQTQEFELCALSPNTFDTIAGEQDTNFTFVVNIHNSASSFYLIHGPNRISANVTVNQKNVFKCITTTTSAEWFINGTSYGSVVFSPFNAAYFYGLFGNNQASMTQKAPSTIYYLRIVDDGVPALDLVPCYRKSDSVAGMYDRVSGEFLTNAGTGTFIVGGDI